jgi:hypothetical protein
MSAKREKIAVQLKVRGADVGIKPSGVKRSETPGSSTQKLGEPAKRPKAVRLQNINRDDSAVGRSADS